MRLIDGDALITELNGIRYPGAPYVDAGIRIAIGKVCDAPTIEERKRGKWIDNTFCSECGWIHEVEPGFIGSVEQFNFCPNCGADMRGEEK